MRDIVPILYLSAAMLACTTAPPPAPPVAPEPAPLPNVEPPAPDWDEDAGTGAVSLVERACRVLSSLRCSEALPVVTEAHPDGESCAAFLAHNRYTVDVSCIAKERTKAGLMAHCHACRR